MGNEKKHRVESLTEQILRHLLIFQYWTNEREYNKSYWEAEIFSFQNQLQRYLTKNLQNYLAISLPEIYKNALKYCQKKTQGLVDFPEECPYDLVDIINPDWLPEQNIE